MPEKFPQSISPSSRDKNETGGETPRHLVEEAAAHVRSAHELCRANPHAAGCDPETLHGLVAATEIADMYERIRAHQGVLFGDITQTIGRAEILVRQARTNYMDEEWLEIEQKLKLLSTRDREIRRATRTYVLTLSQFFQMSRRQAGMSPEDFKSQMEEIDGRRRTAHDGLIESLSVYGRILRWFDQEGLFGDAVLYTWHPGQDVPSLDDNPNLLLSFSPHFLDDREIIQKWAVSTNLHEQIIEIDRMRNEEGHDS